MIKIIGFLISFVLVTLNPCWIIDKAFIEQENPQPPGISCIIDNFSLSSHLLQLGDTLVIYASASCKVGQPFMRLTANNELIAGEATASWWYSLIPSDYAPLGEVILCMRVVGQEQHTSEPTMPREICEHIWIVDANNFVDEASND